MSVELDNRLTIDKHKNKEYRLEGFLKVIWLKVPLKPEAVSNINTIIKSYQVAQSQLSTVFPRMEVS